MNNTTLMYLGKMYADKLHFLSKDTILSLKKDTCIFCNSKFNTKLYEEIVTEWRGSHYTEHEVQVLKKRSLISDLDLYFFNFDFDEGSKSYLRLKEEELVEKIKTQKIKEAPILKRNLESEFAKTNLKEDQKERAVEAVFDDYMDEISVNHFASKSPLEKRIQELFRKFKLADLSSVFEKHYGSGDYCESSDEVGIFTTKYFFYPQGLKSHKKCWIWKNPEEEPSFSLNLKKFFNHMNKNALFENYESLFVDFLDLWRDILDKTTLEINANIYNPLDYVSK